MKTPKNLSTIKPWDCCLKVRHKSEYETIAQNIMKILSRTGNTWRKLSFEEYKTERLKDSEWSDREEIYFNEVVGYTISAEKAATFSSSWK